jgi:hypothetical protein
MAEQFKVVAPMVYLRTRDLAGAAVQSTYYEGAVVTQEDEKDPQPGQILKSGAGSIEHHLETEQLVPLSDPVADIFGPAGTPLPGHAPNVPLTEGGAPVIAEDAGTRVQRVRKATAGIPDDPPKGSASADREKATAEAKAAEQKQNEQAQRGER